MLDIVLVHDKEANQKNIPRIISAEMLLARAWEAKKDVAKAIEHYGLAIDKIYDSDQANNPQLKSLLDKMNTAIERLKIPTRP